ncbi:CPBP family intramembrane glutamic endopeptidase [Gemmobacter aquaticus]|nr:type II CAAX endopeptidase family protein [Gemmobacter aquaticus]
MRTRNLERSSMTETSVAAQPMWLRILQSPLTRLIVLGAAMFQFMGWAQARLEQFHDTPLLGVPIQIALGLAAIALYVAYGKFIERRDVTELSTPGLGREWVIGALIGAGLYTACAVILMVLGIYKVEGLNPLAFLIPNLALAIKSGVFEELLFRGVLFRSVEAIFGSWVGILVSSLVFGLLHLLNPDATLGGAIYISIEAGLLLAAAYLVTRRLWICMGFHMAWNYFQSAVFSGVVSGAVSDPGLLKAKIEGPELLTGGSFGMEHSVVALVLCTTTGVILLMIAIRRGHIMPPMWKR